MIEELENRKWEVLSSRHIVQRDEWLSIREECVKLPNGVVIPSWYIFEFPDWINVIAITKEGRFVIIDQYRHAVQTTNYELVAWVVDKGETPIQAAKRELLEETGYGKGQWSYFMHLSPNPTNHNNTSHTFLVKGVERISDQHLEKSEDIRVHLFTSIEVEQMLKENLIIQALHVAPLYKYLHERGTQN